MSNTIIDNAPILAALAGVSERLVESIKKLVPGLSATTASPKDGDEKQTDLRREGIVSAISILCAIATAWLAFETAVFSDVREDPTHVILFGLIIAAGTRFLNPLVEWLKAVKDAKSQPVQNK